MSELQYQLDLLKAINQKVNSKEKMYRMICDMTDGAFLYFASGSNEVTTLGKWEDFFPFPVVEKRDIEKLYEFVDDSYSIPLREVIEVDKRGEESACVECFEKKKNKWYRFRSRVVYDGDGKPTDKLISITDVTKNHIQVDELNYYSYYDTQTGLYNRNYFIRLLGELLIKGKQENEIVSVIMIDIDDFHKVNDGLGMLAGDEVVEQMGSILKETCSDRIIACHISSDVYCVAIYGNDSLNSPKSFHDYVSDRLKKPLQLSGGQHIYLTVSMGVAQFPEASKNALDLMNCAEVVMLKCKSLGKNSILYFSSDIWNTFRNDVEVERKLRNALNENHFELYFQPQFYSDTQELRGMEALIRWKDAGNHMISPAVFIPIAEKNGTIVPIGNWVIDEAVRNYSLWREKFHRDFILSINISSRQYNRDDFVENVIQVIEKYHVDPTKIELEVTESILIEDFDTVCDKLRALQERGIRISLDDFGTGYSSLSYLKRLPINTLKIDKSFIDTVLSDSATRVITESIVNMVKLLGFESVAEGVELEQQFKYLNGIGCDVVQGFLLGKPLCIEDVNTLLENQA